MTPVKIIRSRFVVLPRSDIDTDQIIPARFLTTTSRAGLGERLFYDWRYRDGQPVEGFPLNDESFDGCEVLVAGENFGCGSSREHAPWALLDYGFRAVVSAEIADIFRNNAIKNGLVPVVIEPSLHAKLLDEAGSEIEIDVERATLTSAGQTVSFPLDAFAQHCLVNGIDELGYLMSRRPEISRYEQART